MAKYQYIYFMQGLSKAFTGGKKVLDNIYLQFYPDAKIGIVGVNGAGKSTLLRIMAGVDKEFSGEAYAADGARVGFLPQEPQLDASKTVFENVMEGLGPIKDSIDEFNAVSAKMAEDYSDELMERMSQLQEQIDAADGWDIDSKVEMAMDALRCPPGDWKVDKLSGGEKRRVALCRILLENPDMLLLDEPTNHLDAESVAWLEKHLVDYAGNVILVTHDRYFLDNVAGWILELDRGQGIPWKGNYSSWLEQKQERVRKEERAESARQKTLERELEWIRMAPKARHAKSKARIKAYESLLSQEADKQAAELEIYIPPGPRLGDVVIEAENVSKSYGDRLLFEGLSFALPPGGIVGVIGPNGAGKTTLFRLITGQEQPDGGTFKTGQTVQLGYVDQNRTLDPDKSIWEEISDGQDTIQLGNRQVNSRAYVSRLNFSGSDQQKKVGKLSGGERQRVNIARSFTQGGRLMLLDEPTASLDPARIHAFSAMGEVGSMPVIVVGLPVPWMSTLQSRAVGSDSDRWNPAQLPSASPVPLAIVPTIFPVASAVMAR